MKATFPYLVDISLGNYCPYNCSFCYTSSTNKGSIASFEYLENLARSLFESNVLEVVFGGGEPTLYEYKDKTIDDVVKLFRSYNFKVGVTSRNYHTKPSFIKTVNSLAFSVNNHKEVGKVAHLSRLSNVYLQNILGLTDLGELDRFFEVVDALSFEKVTLLGPKDFGRGLNTFYHNITAQNIKNLHEKYPNIQIGIDSVAVKMYKQELLDMDVPEYYLTSEEGTNTCYIDAMNKRIQKSSFTHNFLDLSDVSRFKEAFSKL